jgi:ribonucleotide reductase beta subunit family protein with ferritin-like domain
MPLSHIETPKDAYIVDYPQAVEAAIQQMAVFWPAEELGVEEDEADVRVNLTAGERYMLTTLQAILTQYELMIGGDEMWGGRIAKLFPRHEIQRMCAVFAAVELTSHAPFYKLVNETLGLETEEFYTEWKRDPVLSLHIAFIDDKASSDDALEATAALAFLEGAVLFSAFACFKGFNSRGFNLVPHFVSGIDGSAKDENFHSLASAWLFRQCREERTALGNHSDAQAAELDAVIYRMAEDVYEHESRILHMAFGQGGVRCITLEEALHFVRNRIDVVLGRLGLEPLFGDEQGEVSGWFYQSLNTFKSSDFFATTQLQYRRDWAKHKLTFRRELANGL